MELLDQIKSNAKASVQRIVLPESSDERTLKAANLIVSEGLASLILIGDREKVLRKAVELNLFNLGDIPIINPLSHSNKEKYAQLMVELRGAKGMTMETAMELIENPLYLATLMIKAGDADGEVAGAINATGNVLKPAFQYIKTLPGMKVVSGAFIMMFENHRYTDNGILIFADCAVHPNPNARELAEIAIATAKSAKVIAGLEPRVAMMSFSTKGSADHEMVTKVIEATEIAKSLQPDLQIDGELQADAAIVASIGEKKAPGSTIAGHANVLVFPTMEAGNIAYKLVQRLACAQAIGPILQGLAAPINDLSRGCSVDDIVNLVAITANQAIGMK